MNLYLPRRYIFALVCGLTAGATEVRLGAPAGDQTDCVPLVREALQRASSNGARLVFAPGTYHSFPDRALEKTVDFRLQAENVLNEDEPYLYRAVDDGAGNPAPTVRLKTAPRALTFSSSVLL